ncbi:lectin mannose-binding 1 [Anaeramoeba ignava]|uniref:Lectin mannose-binding 1 n=1 Tax=Anaeramoeba ignava TaxID=1746090 RepID=A0A9Q0RCI2_ANAIG|nr:lectin mannose-binding 1 [Anaeramoeba ignava]
MKILFLFFFVFFQILFSNQTKIPPVLNPKLSLIPPSFSNIMQTWESQNIFTQPDKIILTRNKEPIGSIWAKDTQDSRDWMCEIELQSGPSQKIETDFDGIGFWYTKQRKKEGYLFGNTDRFEGLAVLLSSTRLEILYQTMSNDMLQKQTLFEHPINYFGLKEKTKIKISYFEGILKVDFDEKSNGEWVSFESKKLQIPKDYYFGLTFTNLKFQSYHYIYSLKVYETFTYDLNELISERLEKDKNNQEIKESFDKQKILDLLQQVDNNLIAEVEQEISLIENLVEKDRQTLYLDKIIDLFYTIFRLDIDSKKNLQTMQELENLYTRIQTSFLSEVTRNTENLVETTTNVVDQIKEIRRSAEFLNNRFEHVAFETQTKLFSGQIEKKSRAGFWIFFIIFEIIFIIFLLYWLNLQSHIYKLF